ncbi:hypothetical protein Aduo_000364 [Ancylostoma duodenale]
MGESIQSPYNSSRYVTCTSWIRAAPGTKIEVKIHSISDGLNVYACAYAGVEIKTQDDQRLTGYRFCSKDDKKVKTLKSNLTLVPIITYSGITIPLNVTLRYRRVPINNA